MWKLVSKEVYILLHVMYAHCVLVLSSFKGKLTPITALMYSLTMFTYRFE